MTEQQQSTLTGSLPACKTRLRRARSIRGITNERQIGLAFDNTSTDDGTSAIRTQVGQEARQPGGTQPGRANSAPAGQSAAAACRKPDTGQNIAGTRDRMPDRATPNHDSSMGARRSVPGKTEDARASGRLAPIRNRAVAVGPVESEPTPEPPRLAASSRPERGTLLMRMAEVSHATGLSKSSIYRLECAGRFPERIQLSKNSVGWREAEVTAWVQSRPTRRALRNGETW